MDKVINYFFVIRKWHLNKLILAHKKIKYFNILILLISEIMFFSNEIGTVELPNFFKYSKWDIWLWIIVLNSLALVQLLILNQCNCKNTYRWSNIVLMLSGFVLLIVGCLFGVKYPPYSWQMIIYPFVGLVFTAIGRQLNKTTLTKGIYNGKVN